MIHLDENFDETARRLLTGVTVCRSVTSTQREDDMHGRNLLNKPCVGYVRVSTNEQNLSVDAQETEIRAFCERNGLMLDSIHVDQGVSGTTLPTSRKGFQAAIDRLAELDGGYVVILRRDRLARSLISALAHERVIEKAGSRIVSCDGICQGDEEPDPTVTAFLHIMDVVSQLERDLIAKRTRHALKERRERGQKSNGSIRYGWRCDDGVNVVEDPAEQRVIQTLVEWQKMGESYRSMAASLNRQEIPARGKRWHPTTISRILQKEAIE
jgi:DNA invertase Pin-like site-specific DNA recombinase